MNALKHWMYVWIAIGAVVVGVVIGFLIPISNSLVAIHHHLHGARNQLVGAHGDVRPLPAYVQDVNKRLAAIAGALEPVHRDARGIATNVDAVDASLGSIAQTLQPTAATLGGVDRTLGSVTATLGPTAARLSQIAQTIGGIHLLAARIGATLRRTQSDRLHGTSAIPQLVHFVNGSSARLPGHPSHDPRSLRRIAAHARAILAGLRDVNGHLQSICEALPLGAVSGPTHLPNLQPAGSQRC